MVPWMCLQFVLFPDDIHFLMVLINLNILDISNHHIMLPLSQPVGVLKSRGKKKLTF